jgi:hypothetical protein
MSDQNPDACSHEKCFTNNRTKHDFERVDEQELEGIKKLNVYYKYKEYDRKQRSECGVIAQEVQQVMHAVKQIDVPTLRWNASCTNELALSCSSAIRLLGEQRRFLRSF